MFLLFLLWQAGFNPQDYPDAGALIVNEQVFIEYDQTYRSNREREFAIHIFNTRGREDYSDFFEKYNRKTHELELVKTQTILPDGRVMKPEAKAISDLGTVEGMLALAYQDLRTRTVSYSGVQPGALLEYRSTRKSKKAPDDKHISGIILFQGNDPILHKVFKLKVPKTSGIKDMVRGNVKKTKSEDSDFLTFEWSVDSMPRIKAEPNTAPREYFYPRVLFSNYQDWNEVAQSLYDNYKDAVIVSKELGERAKEFKGSRKEILRQVFSLIAREWRDVSLGISDVEFTPIKSSEVYKNRYGNQLDKSCLAIAMLKALGIEAYPAFVSYSSVADLLPMPDYFYSAIVAVPDTQGFTFLDLRFPERQVDYFNISGILEGFRNEIYVSPDIIGRPVLVAKPDGAVFSAIPDFEGPVSEMHLNCVLTQNGDLDGKVNVVLAGLPASLARSYLRHKKDKELQIAIEMLLGSIKTGTVLKSHDLQGLDDPLCAVELEVEFHAPDYVTKQGKDLRFQIPWPGFLFFNILPYFSIAKRTTPLSVVNALEVSSVMKIEYPEEFNIRYQPKNEMTDDSLALTWNSYEIGEKTLTIAKKFVFRKAEYSVDEYDRLKSVFDDFTSTSQQYVVFTEKGK